MSVVSLPAPTNPDRYGIELVCLGNICRSPMAHVVLEAKLDRAGLIPPVEVTSSGTASWHLGKPMDERAAATLAASGYDPSRHRAHHFTGQDFDELDAIVVMDASNLSDVQQALPDEAHPRVRMLRDFDEQDQGADVPDPYYGGDQGFTDVLGMVERATDTLTAQIQSMRQQGGLR